MKISKSLRCEDDAAERCVGEGCAPPGFKSDGLVCLPPHAWSETSKRAWSSRNIPRRRYARVEWKFLVLVDELERENLFTGGVFNIV